MERPAQLLNNVACLIVFIAMSCQSYEPSWKKFIKRHEVVTKTSGGVMYVNDVPFTGTLLTIYENGVDTLEIQEFAHGKEHGVFKQLYPDGQLQSLRYFKQGEKEGTFDAWWENGAKRLEYHFKNGEYEGSGKEWAVNGMPIKSMNYKNGQEAGLQQQWTGQGDLWANYEVRNGRHYGIKGVKSCATLWKDDEVLAH